MESRDGALVQTIRLSDKDKAKLIQAVNAAPSISVGVDPKKLSVTPSHAEAVLSLTDAGPNVDFAVLAYRCARQSVCLIHGRYIHPDTRCRVRFRGLNGDWHERTGATGLCIHVQGLIHALQVTFEETINLDEFALLTPEQETQHLQEIAQEIPNDADDTCQGLVSRVLYVDDQPADRKLLNYWLGQAGMQVTTVATGAAAMEQAEEADFDLLIVDLRLTSESGVDLIRNMRGNRFVQPILAVSADSNTQLHEDALSAGANGFLAKPYTQAQIVETTKQLMGVDEQENRQPIYSTLSDDPQMVPLLTGYVRNLSSKMTELREANGKHHYETLERMASGLKGSGTSYGYPAITEAAAAVLAALDDGMPDIDAIKRITNNLLSVMGRVKLSRPTHTGQRNDAAEGEYVEPKL